MHNLNAILLILLCAAVPMGNACAAIWRTLRQRKGGRHGK